MHANTTRSENITKIRAIFDEVLKTEGTPLDRHFFELNGTSLGVINCVMKINKAFSARLDAETFLKIGTVAGIAELLPAQT
jgi:acyl carrier protein